jgi:hypothetical protein
MGKYLAMLSATCEKSELSEQRYSFGCSGSNQHNQAKELFRLSRLFRNLAELERHIPEHVSQAAWEAAVEDGKRFLAKWGAQAEALGWTEQDLFGLHRPPDKPAAGYSRLARYDATGLVWLLRGRRVCALTERSAAIKNRTSGTVTHFRRGKT